MSIEFIPGGYPISSSYSDKAGLALNTSVGGKPITASIAEYAAQNIGPRGPEYIIIGDGYDTTKVKIVNV